MEVHFSLTNDFSPLLLAKKVICLKTIQPKQMKLKNNFSRATQKLQCETIKQMIFSSPKNQETRSENFS